MKTVLITGGAGFIGSHLADLLLREGYRVRALDNLEPQVHPAGRRPGYLDEEVELCQGDVTDPALVDRALQGVEAVVHLAARVGVGQSMYQMADYTRTNDLGTAVLLEAMTRRPVERLVVASSMSIYGEGLYRGRDSHAVQNARRSPQQLRERQWNPTGLDGGPLSPAPTPEWKQPDLASIYALSKYHQERMCLIFGRAYDVPTVALRFFNVYGSRQALSNPYTGVLAIFASRLLNGRPPLVYEDGLQRRDFVHVHDVARACQAAMTAPQVGGKVFNIGSGQSVTVLDIARRVARAMGRPIEAEVTGRCRVGDIRHCYADISRAARLLDYRPRMSLEEGLAELIPWLEHQRPEDRTDQAQAELSVRGLTV